MVCGFTVYKSTLVVYILVIYKLAVVVLQGNTM